MIDPKVQYIIKVLNIHLGAVLTEDSAEIAPGYGIVVEFMENKNSLKLYAYINANKLVEFANKLVKGTNFGKIVTFYKSKPCVLEDVNSFYDLLHVTILNGSPSSALYHSLKNVYLPLLNQEDKTISNIQRQLACIQEDLRTAILTSDSSKDSDDEIISDALSVVTSLEHELIFWNNQVKNLKGGEVFQRAMEFRDILKPLVEEFCVINALQLNEVDNILENAHNVLDDLWRHSNRYPKERMLHLLDIIASDVEMYLKNRLKDLNTWTEDFNVVSDVLQQSIGVTEHWLLTCKQLTEIFWPNYSLHSWTDPPFEPVNLVDLNNRLQDVLKILTTHKQLVRLLTLNEQEDLEVNGMFKPFEDLDLLECGSHKIKEWATAKQQFEYLLRPAEQRVAVKLKKQFSGINDNVRQLLHEFSRYSELISRPVMKSTLLNERQYLLASLKDYVGSLESNANPDIFYGNRDVSPIVGEIMNVRQLEVEVQQVLKTSEKVLSDLDNYNDFKHHVSELLKHVKQQHGDLFNSWTSEVTAKIRDKSLSLQETDPVVKFSTNQLMIVNYSSRLVTLSNEVRQLSSMGYRIPSNIEETSTHAKQFIKYARILEQIANFHNTFGDRMIPSQRPMMLTSAVNLSKLVQDQEVVSWGTLKSVDKYVESLKTAVEQLSKDNNYLTACHHQILERVTKLEYVDLIKDYDKWKESAKAVREIVAQVQQKGFKSMQSWKLDIDKTIVVVLEKQYLKSLDTLHLYLPEIYTDLVYRNSELQFSPAEDVLRAKYQQQLKRFVDIPKTFRGVSETPEGNVFAEIIDKNENEISKVNTHMNDLFDQLHSTKNHWQSWLPREEIDRTALQTWQQWDLHFRASKTFGQEIAKLPSNEEKVGCFYIGLSRLRSDLEAHNRSQWDLLVSSLKDSIAEDVVRLQQYVDPSTATLTKHPVTIEQIGEAGASHANILKQFEEMESLYKEMHQKAVILSSWTREKVDSVGRLTGAWERLQSLLENHQHIIAKQVETVKTTLNIANENLQEEIERFAAKWEQVKPKPGAGHIVNDNLDQLRQHLDNIKEKRTLWNALLEQQDQLLKDYEKFGLEKPQMFSIDTIEADLEREQKMWVNFEEFYAEFTKMAAEEWIVFRKKTYKFDDFLNTWRDKLEKTENSALITRMLQEIRRYEEVVPVLKYVRGDEYTDKHWLEVFSLAGMTPKAVDVLGLKDFLVVSEKLVEQVDKLKALSKRAASEVVVRQALSELDQWEVEARFELTIHVDSSNKPISVIKNYKEILGKIGDNQSLLQSVKNSSDYESFSERAEIWETRLSDLDKHLTSMAQIQRKWMYLEPIFSSGTLEQEKVRFQRLDKEFRHLFTYIERDVRVTALLRYPSLRSVLENLQNQLSRCQQSLEEFLTSKREKFPRFLFLGDDDLLEVVGQSSKEKVIQTHLKKLFAGINSIILDGNGKKIVAMCSLQGEVVALKTPVDINTPVEKWLNVLVGAMQDSLKDLLVHCLSEGNKADPLKYPSQILCLAESISFTTKCENAIETMTLPPLLAHYKAQLSHFSSFEGTDDAERSLTSFGSAQSDDESNLLEIKLKALLLDTIHYISILESLTDANVTSTNDWMWQRQLRFYSGNNGNVTVKMAHASIEYSYEYLGNGQKLVRTPLTDRCFLTLTQGMYLGMGGNPYGPAGTGKTESVKALGALLGRQVLVFNCDEGIDAVSMGRILSGLVRSGAWGCFDEFNRLDETTLSAISMYIQPIQTALKTHQNSVTLLGQEMSLNKHCGIFVTLNPAGGNYGGRNRLPDNLKQLFRPVIMTHPDHLEIARTLLHCDGYRNADVIGAKLVEVLDLAGKLLSKKQHYDWGLRAIRTVLGSCGRALKIHRKSSQMQENESLETELSLVVKSLRTDTLSKLTFRDSLKFDGLLQDIFRGIHMDGLENGALAGCLKETCKELGLQVNLRQISKCIQLYEQLKQRMGVALVGPPGSGKTTVRKLLFHALTKNGKQLKQHVLNPKAMARYQLLGQIDANTRQWSDGVLTSYSLQVTSEPSEVWSWIVCDGDIDPEWVESLNSVLDDNRLLTLPSGWRIQFGPNVNFLFETHSLEYASPATVSRMGIVFLSEEDLNLNDYVSNFLAKQQDYVRVVLEPLIGDYLFKGLSWVTKKGETALNRSKLSILSSALSYLEDVATKTQFAVALVNALGCQLTEDFKEVFAQEVFEWTGELPPSNVMLAHYNNEKDLIDTYCTPKDLGDEGTNSNVPLIMTSSVQQTVDCLKKWLVPGKEQSFLLVGEHGAGKSLVLEHLVKERLDVDMATIHCSAHVTPQYVIHKFAQHCMVINTNKGKVYKPKKTHLLLHFKNIHLLKPDDWGTNMLLAFLQQLVTYKGFFDSSLEWVGTENIIIVGSLCVRNNLPARFTSSLHVYNLSLPGFEDLTVIIFTHLLAIVRQLPIANQAWPKSKISKLTNTMLAIYGEIKSTFTSIDQYHYIFSPHDLTSWCRNLLHYEIESEGNLERWLLEVTCHEALRLFSDKLVNESDKSKLFSIINSHVQKHWGISNILASIENHFFVSFEKTNKKKNKLIKLSEEDWTSTVKRGIHQYEREGQNLNLTLINELLHLCASAANALAVAQGHLVMVGRSGVGRRSATKIISALMSTKLIVPVSCNQNKFNADLKGAIQSVVLDEEVYFLLEDHILKNDGVLSVVNTLISSGEVPGLYSSAEMDSLFAGLKEEASQANFDGDLSQYFTNCVRSKLHVIVCLDVDNEDLLEIFEKCPALYQNCALIWLTEWSTLTMQNIPKIMGQSNENVVISQEFCDIYDVIKQKFGAPSRYVALLEFYMQLYLTKKEISVNNQKKLQAGVSKLTEARNVVAELRKNASLQQQKLEEKQSKANSALEMISNTMKNANIQKEEMQVLKQQTELENQQLIKRKKEIEEELKEVEPLIQEARAAVGNIKPESLSEIRSLRAPPDIIRDILEGVLRLMGIQDTSWNSMKTFLAKRGVKEDIRSFDASRIGTDSRQMVERLMASKSDSFDQKSAKRASAVAAPLAAWVIANVKYSRISEKIRPLEREQNRLKQNLRNAELQLDELSTGLLDVDATVARLKEELSTYTKEAAEIEIGLGKAQNTLISAEGLVRKLNEEYGRWQDQLQELAQEQKSLPLKCLLSASFITYLSGESEDERMSTLNKWVDVIVRASKIDQPTFVLQEFLSSEREQLQWQSEGLAADQLSIQNAIIILKGNLCPLILDPSSIAMNWLKAHLKHKTLETVTQDSEKFGTKLDLAVRFGKVLIVEEIEGISSSLFPILKREFVFQGERKLININGRLVDLHIDFQLILSSRNANLHISSELYAIVNVVNFTITHAGLTEQLLTNAICQESPKLGERRNQLLKEREDMQEKLHVFQTRLLEDLAASTGNLLENTNLLNSLNETKSSSVAIANALSESTKLQQQLSEESATFEEISAFGSFLYFASKEISKVNPMYLLSVRAYTRLFLRAISSFEGTDVTFEAQQRLLVQSLYRFMARGIFKSDRLVFAMHLLHKVFPEQIPNQEWNLFVGNILVASKQDPSSSESPGWIPQQSIQAFVSLQLAVPKLYGNLRLNDFPLWKNFMEDDGHDLRFPAHCKLREFQKVIVVQLLRPDKLYTVMQKCVYHLTGLTSIHPEIVHLSQILKESLNSEPVLLLIASGNDPSFEIKQLGERLHKQYVEIAMGENQENEAVGALNRAIKSGNWLVLKNLHLVVSWLPMLCQNLQQSEIHDDFRLWLVTEQHPNFSPVLVQQCLKVVYEAPQGLKYNLQHSYAMWGDTYVDRLTPTAARIFFVCTCVHAILQERRTYIPQGWLNWYEFSDVDMTTAVKLAENLWDKQNVQWKYLIGLFRDAVYGGRIENLQDLKILDAYLRSFFADHVLSHRWRPFDLQSSLPTTANYRNYLEFVTSLPNSNLPSHFGLPENINRAWEKTASASVISQLKDLDLTKHITTHFNLKVWQKSITPFVSLWKKLNQGHDFIKSSIPELVKDGSPLAIFVSEEYKGAIATIHFIHKNFTMLHKILRGSVLPDESLVEFANCLIGHKTPKSWLRFWQGPKDPSKYLHGMLSKTINLEKWRNNGNFLNEPLNLTHCFHPEAFIASYKQEFSRTHSIPIDQLTLQANWSPQNSTRGIVLTGLLVEGALFDGRNLSPSKSNSENITTAPNCFLTWRSKNQFLQNDKFLDVPLYFTSAREKQLTVLQVSCNIDANDLWILSGLAFLLDY